MCNVQRVKAVAMNGLFRQMVTATGIAFALLAANVEASVTIGGTRVVYPLDQREVTVRLDNDSLGPSLVQTWIDDGNADAKPNEIHVPFVITPPIFRMDPKKAQILRVMFVGNALPQDRESVYWLNVLDIPPKPDSARDANSLQLAYRTRIKLFARPAGLPDEPEDAPARLSWTLVASPRGKGHAVSVSNPTPYYVSFSEVDVGSDGHTYKNEEGGMVAPRSTTVLPVAGMSAVTAGATVRYIAINDYGGPIKGDAPLRQ
jgi:chaperone protein EcpD